MVPSARASLHREHLLTPNALTATRAAPFAAGLLEPTELRTTAIHRASLPPAATAELLPAEAPAAEAARPRLPTTSFARAATIHAAAPPLPLGTLLHVLAHTLTHFRAVAHPFTQFRVVSHPLPQTLARLGVVPQVLAEALPTPLGKASLHRAAITHVLAPFVAAATAPITHAALIPAPPTRPGLHLSTRAPSLTAEPRAEGRPVLFSEPPFSAGSSLSSRTPLAGAASLTPAHATLTLFHPTASLTALQSLPPRSAAFTLGTSLPLLGSPVLAALTHRRLSPGLGNRPSRQDRAPRHETQCDQANVHVFSVVILRQR